MSISKCPKCEKTGFEIVTEEPLNSKYKINFIRCQWCKSVVGTTEFYNIGSLIYKLAKKLNINLDL